MSYKLYLTRRVHKDLRSIPKDTKKHINKAISNLHGNPLPHNSKKIQNIDDYYRIRIRNYRIIYHFKKQIVTITIVKIQHRKDVYKNFP
ncbi:type II toxin-antitoxin system mRNA interferase toxin, RelE/StbE family [Patescibacteria group bacterium]|nr:type II toxin-antitoxin system mRNA interferase toxin, RelE/StbE family [Patescibacteria group bacterium]MBU1123116.1 type II toxin-antitoxin system mRNA interferase toxin, RelE/StbE family [Patescibacteria group bacterium]